MKGFLKQGQSRFKEAARAALSMQSAAGNRHTNFRLSGNFTQQEAILEMQKLWDEYQRTRADQERVKALQQMLPIFCKLFEPEAEKEGLHLAEVFSDFNSFAKIVLTRLKATLLSILNSTATSEGVAARMCQQDSLVWDMICVALVISKSSNKQHAALVADMGMTTPLVRVLAWMPEVPMMGTSPLKPGRSRQNSERRKSVSSQTPSLDTVPEIGEGSTSSPEPTSSHRPSSASRGSSSSVSSTRSRGSSSVSGGISAEQMCDTVQSTLVNLISKAPGALDDLLKNDALKLLFKLPGKAAVGASVPPSQMRMWELLPHALACDLNKKHLAYLHSADSIRLLVDGMSCMKNNTGTGEAAMVANLYVDVWKSLYTCAAKYPGILQNIMVGRCLNRLSEDALWVAASHTEAILKLLFDFIYVGDRNLEVPKHNDNPFESMDEWLKNINSAPPSQRVRNVEAFGAVQQLLFDCDRDHIRQVILERILDVYSGNPVNYLLLRGLKTLPLAFEKIDVFGVSVRSQVLGVLEYLVMVLNIVPFEELCAMACLVTEDMTVASFEIVVASATKIVLFDERYRDIFREVGLLEAISRELKLLNELNIYESVKPTAPSSKESVVSLLAKTSIRDARGWSLLPDEKHEEKASKSDRAKSTQLAGGDIGIKASMKNLYLALLTFVTSCIRHNKSAVGVLRKSGGISAIAELMLVEWIRRPSLKLFETISTERTWNIDEDMATLVSLVRSCSVQAARASESMQLDLGGLFRTLLRIDNRVKHAFAEKGGFDAIVDLLNPPEEAGTVSSKPMVNDKRISVDHGRKSFVAWGLFDAYFRVIICAVDGCNFNRQFMSNTMGYERDLRSLFSHAIKHYQKESREIATLLLDLAVENSQGMPPEKYYFVENPVVRNPEAIVLLTKMGPSMSEESRHWTLNILSKLVENNFVNKQALSAVGIVGTLMRLYPEALTTVDSPVHSSVIRILVNLGSFSLSSTELRMLMQFMRPASKEPELLYDCFLDMLRSESTSSFIEFDGRTDKGTQRHHSTSGAGVQAELFIEDLNKNCQWPPPGGYTFMCWFCVEEPSPSIPLSLFTIVSDGQIVLDISIEHSSEVVNNSTIVVNIGSQGVVEFENVPLKANQWFHFAISHEKSRVTMSSVTLYLNGIMLSQNQIKYPLAVNGIAQGFVGWTRPAGLPKSGAPPCLWKLGSCCLVGEAVAGDDLFVLHGMRRGYRGCFLGDIDSYMTYEHINEDSLNKFPKLKSTSVNYVNPRDDVPTYPFSLTGDRVIFSYYAHYSRVVNQHHDTPSTILYNAADSKSGVPKAVIRGNVNVFVPAALADRIREVGGLSVVISFIRGSRSPTSLKKCLHMLVRMIKWNSKNTVEMNQIHGYEILNDILREKVDLIDIGVLNIVLEFVGVRKSNGWAGGPVSNPRAFRFLLLDFELWMDTHQSVQTHFWQQLTAITEDRVYGLFNLSRLRQMNIIPAVCFLLMDGKNDKRIITPAVSLIRSVLSRRYDIADLESVVHFLVTTLVSPTSENTIWAGTTPATVSPNHSRGSMPAQRSSSIASNESLGVDMQRCDLIRNIMLKMLLDMALRLMGPHIPENERAANDESINRIFQAINSRFIFCLFEFNASPLTAMLAIKLLTVHLRYKPENAKQFREIFGFQITERLLLPYYGCEGVYMALLGMLTGVPIARMPQEEIPFTAANVREMLKGVEIRVEFGEVIGVIVSMLKRLSEVTVPFVQIENGGIKSPKSPRSSFGLSSEHRGSRGSKIDALDLSTPTGPAPVTPSPPLGSSPGAAARRATRMLDADVIKNEMKKLALASLEQVPSVKDMESATDVRKVMEQQKVAEGVEEDEEDLDFCWVALRNEMSEKVAPEALFAMSAVMLNTFAHLFSGFQEFRDSVMKGPFFEDLAGILFSRANISVPMQLENARPKTTALERVMDLAINTDLANSAPPSRGNMFTPSGGGASSFTPSSMFTPRHSFHPSQVQEPAQKVNSRVELLRQDSGASTPMGRRASAQVNMLLEDGPETPKGGEGLQRSNTPRQRRQGLDASSVGRISEEPEAGESYSSTPALSHTPRGSTMGRSLFSRNRGVAEARARHVSFSSFAANSDSSYGQLMIALSSFQNVHNFFQGPTSVAVFRCIGEAVGNQLLYSPKGFALLEVVLETYPPSLQLEFELLNEFQNEVLVSVCDSIHDVKGKVLKAPKTFENVSQFCNLLVNRVVGGIFPSGNILVVNFLEEIITTMIQDMQSRSGDKAERIRLSELYRQLNTIILHIFQSGGRGGETDTMYMLENLNEHKQVIFGEMNIEDNFFRCLCFHLSELFRDGNEDVCDIATELWKVILRLKPTSRDFLVRDGIDLWSKGFKKLHDENFSSSDFHDWVDSSTSDIDAVFHYTLRVPWTNWVQNQRALTAGIRKRPQMLAAQPKGKQRSFIKRTATSQRVLAYSLQLASSLAVVQETVMFRYRRYRHLRKDRQALATLSWLRLEKYITGPRGIWGHFDDGEPEEGWSLDFTEGPGRMRKKLERSGLAQSYNVRQRESEAGRRSVSPSGEQHRKGAIDFISGRPGGSNEDGDRGRSKTELSSETPTKRPSLPEAGWDNDLFLKHHTDIARMLVPGDQIEDKFNCSLIVGIQKLKGIFIMCTNHAYMFENYCITETGELVEKFDKHESEWIGNEEAKLTEDATIWSTDSDVEISRILSRDHLCHRFAYEDVVQVHKRRYLLRQVALELFETSGRSHMLTFQISERDVVFNKLLQACDSRVSGILSTARSVMGRSNDAQVRTDTDAAILSAAKDAQQHWRKGEMSNFDYLMVLNTLAGRTYNDLTQYPVFPWVLADYESPELDLNNPSVFRDLGKPMGALGEDRAEEFQMRYETWEDDEIPKFHYGTHYSSAGIVCSYLMRLPPFTQQLQKLQGGNFDHSDRLFRNIGHAWRSASELNMTDVKELIPEFYYSPDFLVNQNRIDFGTTQDGEVVDDIILPPWAKGDPRIFIQRHRQALESEYVSANLHKWIDLIFGYKQQGKAAAESQNLFYYLTYEGAVDIDSISDPNQRRAMKDQINNFGQTPKQIFKKAHPERQVSIPPIGIYQYPNAMAPTREKEIPGPVGSIELIGDKVNILGSRSRLLFQSSPVVERYLLWGFADLSLRVYTNENDKSPPQVIECAHDRQITCVAAGSDGRSVATGGRDSIVNIWRRGRSPTAPLKHFRSLHGHFSSVSCIVVSVEFGIIVSGGEDKTAIIWDLNRAKFHRHLVGHGGPVVSVAVNPTTGDVVTCCENSIGVWSVNGEPLCFKVLDVNFPAITVVTTSSGPSWIDSGVIVTGHSQGWLCFWSIDIYSSSPDVDETDELQVVARYALKPRCSPLKKIHGNDPNGRVVRITALKVAPDNRRMYSGDSTGMVVNWTIPDNSEREEYWKNNEVECKLCEGKLSPFNRHHCRHCRLPFCSKCCDKRIELPDRGYCKPVRVCDTCYASRYKSHIYLVQ